MITVASNAEIEEIVDEARAFLESLRVYKQPPHGVVPEVAAERFAKALLRVVNACVVGLPCPRHAGMLHGQEAEELRKGVEQIVNNTSSVEGDAAEAVLAATRKALTFLLDHTDARDSLAFGEVTALAESKNVPFDPMLDPLPGAHEALRLKGVVAPLEVMNLALALITAHTKVDQLYNHLENRSVALTHVTLEAILRYTDQLAPSAAAYRDLRGWVQVALEDLQAQANDKEIELELDHQRVEYLSKVPTCFADARRRMINTSVSFRDAVDFCMGRTPLTLVTEEDDSP